MIKLCRRFGEITLTKNRARVTETIITKRHKILKPNHYTCAVLGGGRTGLAMVNNLINLVGLSSEHILLIEPATYMGIDGGLDLLPYDILDEEDARYPVLRFLQNHSDIKFEEVVNIDPDNKFVATYEGSEHTYDYLVNCTGLRPCLKFCKNLEEALDDEFSFVMSSFDLESALKMRTRLGYVKKGEVLVYHSGEHSKPWWQSVNHAFLLRDKLKQDTHLVVEGPHILSNEQQNQFVLDMLDSKGIRVTFNLRLESIPYEGRAEFSSSDCDTLTGLDFSLFYVQPHYRIPPFLENSALLPDDFDKSTFQHKTYLNTFAVGSYINPHSSNASAMEDTHTASTNLNYQLRCDFSLPPYNLEQSSGTAGISLGVPLFPSLRTQVDLPAPNAMPLSVSSPSFYSLLLYLTLKYPLYSRRTKQSKWWGVRRQKEPLLTKVVRRKY